MRLVMRLNEVGQGRDCGTSEEENTDVEWILTDVDNQSGLGSKTQGQPTERQPNEYQV